MNDTWQGLNVFVAHSEKHMVLSDWSNNRNNPKDKLDEFTESHARLDSGQLEVYSSPKSG